MKKPVILIIDSNDWDREQIRSYLLSLSRPVRVIGPTDLDSGRFQPDIIVLGFSDAISFETSQSDLARARLIAPHSQLILCAAGNVANLDNKVLKLKARAFLLKPVDQEMFRTLFEETLAQIQLRQERAEYARAAKKAARIESIVGDSPQIKDVLKLMAKVAQSSSTSVLLLGESGVGKSLFAQTIHDLCGVSSGPFIEINCAALPSALLESELFGYEPGAFTDAKSQKIGLIELADGGTLFLDEITEVDIVTQAKLLKFLDTKRFRRLGGDLEIPVATRVVAASNRDMRSAVANGEFREDLLYRLNVVEVNIPPLRERPTDIRIIAEYYFDYYKKKFNKAGAELTPEAVKLLDEYHWPGNVRELINVLERTVLLSPPTLIGPERIPIERTTVRRLGLNVSRIEDQIHIEIPAGGVPLEALERAAIEATLRVTRGNVSRAATMLGLSRGALRNRLSRLGIDPQACARQPVLV